MKTRLQNGVILIKNQSGQSLVQVLVSAAIMCAGALMFASLINSQSRETRALSEKLAWLDTERALIAHLGVSANCSALFSTSNLTNPASMPFNGQNLSTSTPFALPLIGVPFPGGTNHLVRVGETVSPMANSLVVSQIELNVTGSTNGRLVVNFDNTRLIRALPSLSFALSLVSTGPLTSLTLSGCTGGAQVCVERRSTQGIKGPCGFVSSVQCAPDEVATAGGAYGAANVALQNSSITYLGAKPNGWVVTFYNTAVPMCSSNGCTPDGTVNNGSPPSFPINPACDGNMTGGAWVMCCKP